MITDILILSRFEMVKIIHSIQLDNKLPKKKFLVISCFGNEQHFIKNNGGKYTPNVLIKGHKEEALRKLGMIDYVNVFCDDLTPEDVVEIDNEHPGEYLIKLFDQDNANDVINFIEKYKDEDCILISHCDAGVSRSSAHAVWLSELLGYPSDYFVEKYPYIKPNEHILKTLREEKAKFNK